MAHSFQFKQFFVQQDLCAMKVGTDGVLLGAWLQAKEGDLLDIGSGTGLIALMLAQRTQKAIIDAIDTDEQAFIQTKNNVEVSKWKKRITTFHTAVQDFKTDKKYDLIFTNPPYFIDATKAPLVSRNRARHTDTLSFDDLLTAVTRMLAKNGIFGLILPVNEAILFIKKAEKHQFFLNRKCEVKPNLEKAVKRIMMEFSFQKKRIITEELTIETEKRHQYTKEYINLTQDFYLNF